MFVTSLMKPALALFVLGLTLLPATAVALSAEDFLSGGIRPVTIKSALPYRLKWQAEREKYIQSVSGRIDAISQRRYEVVHAISHESAIAKSVEKLAFNCGAAPIGEQLNQCLATGDYILDSFIDGADAILNFHLPSPELTKDVNAAQARTLSLLIEVMRSWRSNDFYTRKNKRKFCSNEHLGQADFDSIEGQKYLEVNDLVNALSRIMKARAQSTDEAILCKWIEPESSHLVEVQNRLFGVVATGKPRVEALAFCRKNQAVALAVDHKEPSGVPQDQQSKISDPCQTIVLSPPTLSAYTKAVDAKERKK